MLNSNNISGHAGGAKLSGVPSNNQPSSYGNFPTGSPSQNINTQHGSHGTILVNSPSSQGTISSQSQNQSPQQPQQQPYQARVISQPDLNA